MKPTLLLFLSCLLLFSCTTESQTTGTESSQADVHFYGDQISVEMADKMMEALGGRKKWAAVKALYIKANHIGQGPEDSYQSETWRDLSDFKVRMERQNDRFHSIGLFSDAGGWVMSGDDGSTNELDETAMSNLRFGNAHNLYVMWKRLATDPGYQVDFQGSNREISFHQGLDLLCAFILDERNLPVRFIAPLPNGEAGPPSDFRKWAETDGLWHPVSGGPSDSSFVYQTEVWQPSFKGFEESFEVAYQP
ncbi:MAG: hypothetical protein AAF206_31935 [Bacteroidota bacterium]